MQSEIVPGAIIPKMEAEFIEQLNLPSIILKTWIRFVQKKPARDSQPSPVFNFNETEINLTLSMHTCW